MYLAAQMQLTQEIAASEILRCPAASVFANSSRSANLPQLRNHNRRGRKISIPGRHFHSAPGAKRSPDKGFNPHFCEGRFEKKEIIQENQIIIIE